MFELHRLTITPHMRCSFHVHRFKHNAFYVIAGELWLDMADQDLCFSPNRSKDGFDGTVCIKAGGHMTLNPGVHHQFRTGELPCSALECYYCEPLSEDIIRRNVGGPV